MAVYAIGEAVPQIAPSAYVHPDATVIGNVTLGPGASVWPQAVLRGDYGRIVVGARTSIQDGAVLHCIPIVDTVVGEDCVIGHLVHMEACTVEDRCLIGVGAKILLGATVRSGATVGANAVVTSGTEIPAGALAVGVPAVVKARRGDPERVPEGVQAYLDNAARYRTGLRRLDG